MKTKINLTPRNRSRVFCIVGQKGSGKTYFIEKHFFEKYNKKIIFYVNENFEKNQINKNILLLNSETFFKNFDKINFKNNILILDDAVNFVNYSKMTKAGKIIQKIATLSRHYNLIVIFVYHDLDDIPAFLIGKIDKFIIFKNKYFTKKKRFSKELQEVVSFVNNSEKKFFYKIVEN